MEIVFYGHRVYPNGLSQNVILALLPFAFLFLYEKACGRATRIGLGALFLVFLPNTTYLFLEIKHALLTDGIADYPHLEAQAVFFGLSALGLYLNVLAVLYATKILAHDREFAQKASIIIMGVLCGFGGVLGLGNLTSVVMLIAPAKTTLAIAQILGRISQVLLSLVLSALLAKITFNVKKQIDTS